MSRLALCGICGVWLMATGATTFMAACAGSASAADLGLIMNGDIEQPTLLGPFPNDHPNGHPHAWHYSTNSAWSNPAIDPFVSATHSLYSPDDNFGGLFPDVDDEHRSYATAIPGFGTPGRSLDVTWNWNWDITSAPGDKFSATVRISTAPVVALDLVGIITDFVFLTDGTANSGGFQSYSVNIPLTAAHRSFDIIFATGDEVGLKSEAGVLFVDDIRADLAYAADFDVDRDVDGDDLAQWQGDYGAGAGSDADNDGDSDGADFLFWQRQAGSGVPLVSAAVAVPEPSTFGLAAWAALAVSAIRVRRHERTRAVMVNQSSRMRRSFKFFGRSD
ncbi:MAG: hypothetical protein SH868_00955 [Bythopirellula sp.]|nr:hypothetical protein [Bythopirellula sp.]